MSSILNGVLLFSIVAQGAMLVFLQFNRIPTRLRAGWLYAAILSFLLATAAQWLIVTEVLPFPALRLVSAAGLALMFISYGQYMLRDLLHAGRAWLGLGAVWLLAILAAALVVGAGYEGEPGWLMTLMASVDLLDVALLGGLIIAIAVLLLYALRAFYTALLPEIANRIMFWMLNTAALAVGLLLFATDTMLFQVVGALLVLAALAGAVYAHVSYRVYDIRSALGSAIRTALLVALASVVIFAVLMAADTLLADPTDTQEDRLSALLLLSVLGGILYVVLRQLLGLILRPLAGDSTWFLQAARQYSQQVTRAVELSELIWLASETLNRVMRVRRSGMLLVNDTSDDSDRVEVIVMKDDNSHDLKGYIAKSSPVYERLALKRLPLSQFDLTYGPSFQQMAETERQFFESLQMSAYAPIIVDHVLIGLLMCGPKTNDAPYHEADLALLATMADQTGVALRNSRAMADLKHLNATMSALNAELEDANQQYEKLDSVKTDFITIASHELRTPLAQIRGYTDILDTLNEQGMLDQEQAEVLVSNLQKATERTEELLTAMLDMSQLDINAMDLRFTQAAPESILRMAIDPLTEHIKQRRLTLSARGLRSLPTIHCDIQRLVQAFRNIITNAIKFTPDGGRINITASTQSAAHGADDDVLISISDTGVGIEKENLELIFEKFYRTSDPTLHSTGTYKFMGAGPGLGLTIARGVIEGHGGKVWAESSGHNMETCPGSTFYVLLPVNPPDETRRLAIDDTNAHRSPAQAQSPLS